MGDQLRLVKMMADEVRLVVRQSFPVSDGPIVYLRLEGSSILVGVSFGEEFVRRFVMEMREAQLNIPLRFNPHRSQVLISTSD